MKKNGSIQTKRKQNSKSVPTRGPVQRDTPEVMTELVAKLAEQLDSQRARVSAEEEGQPNELHPHIDRLTVG